MDQAASRPKQITVKIRPQQLGAKHSTLGLISESFQRIFILIESSYVVKKSHFY